MARRDAPRRRSRAPALLAALGTGLATALAGAASTTTHKCLIDGRTVYQQVACPAGAEPQVASASAVAAPAAATSASPRRAASASTAAARTSAGSAPAR